jgi:hypothetical protein
MENSFLSNGYVSGYVIRRDMNTAGFTNIAVGIALKTLGLKGMTESDIWNDPQDGDPYTVYKPTAKGEKWLIDNQDKLQLRSTEQQAVDDDFVPM